MATAAKPAADTEAAVKAVRDIAERIVPLAIADNTEAVTALVEEAEAIITNSFKGTSAAKVQLRTDLRAEISDAAASKASGDLVKREDDAPAELVLPGWMVELVTEGADAIEAMGDANATGQAKLSEVIFKMRLNTLNEDGLPSIDGGKRGGYLDKVNTLMFAKASAKLADEGQSAKDDDIRAGHKGIKKQSQNGVRDLRAVYMRSLDDPANAEEAAKYASIEVPDGMRLSEAVAAHFNVALTTRAEQAALDRQAKALEKSDGPKELTSGGAGDSEGNGEDKDEAEATVLSSVRSMLANIVSATSVIATVNSDELAAQLVESDDAMQGKMKEDIRSAMNRLKILLAMVEA